MWPFSKPTSYLGIDIGSHGVKLVELKKKGKRAHLFTYAYTDKELGQNQTDGLFFEVGKVANLIKEMVKKCRAVSRQAVAALPASAVYSSLITIPQATKKEEKISLIRKEAEKLLPWPLAEVVLDWKIVRLDKQKAQGSEDVLITAAPRQLIASYSEIFKMAGLALLSLETEALALIQSLIGKDPAPILLVDIGAAQTDFFVVEKSFPIFFHSLKLGGRNFTEVIQKNLGVEQAEAEQIKRDLQSHSLNNSPLSQFPAIFEPIIRPLIEAIRYSFEIYRRQKGDETARPEKIILSGGSALIPYLDVRLSEIFNLKVYVGDPWARVIYDQGLKPALDSLGPRFTVAIGLALKKIEG